MDIHSLRLVKAEIRKDPQQVKDIFQGKIEVSEDAIGQNIPSRKMYWDAVKNLIDGKDSSEDLNIPKDDLKEIRDTLLDVGIIKEPESAINQLDERQKQTLKMVAEQVKFIGFGEGISMREEIAKGILENKNTFSIQRPADNPAFKQNKIDFQLNFVNNQKGTFFNGYSGKLVNMKTGEEKNHKVPVFPGTFTAKETLNLLEGRSVKKEYQNDKNEKTFSFIRLNFKEKFNESNYKFANTYPSQVKPTAELLKDVNFKQKIDESKLQPLVKSLEKGNVVKADFIYDKKEYNGHIVLNPVNNQISLYNENMVRLNPTQQNQINQSESHTVGHQKQNKQQRSIG